MTDAEKLAERINFFRQREEQFRKPTRVYCKRRLKDEHAIDPLTRIKYLTHISAACETLRHSVFDHARRLFDLSNMTDLEDIFYSRNWDAPIQQSVLILGCMELVKDDCYE